MAPFFHIAGFWALGLTLATGATLVFSPRFKMETFLGAIQEHRVTRASVVPPILLALANEPMVDTYDLSSLWLIVLGGAPVGSDLMRRCAARLGCRCSKATA